MALGNNLKRIKKDSLIPSKKESAPKSKAKITVAKKPKAKKKTSPKPKVVAKPKKQVEVKKTIAPKKQVVEIVSNPSETAHLNERVLLGGKEGAVITATLIPSRRKTVRKTKLVFEGSLSLQEAEVIKDCLLTTFTDFDIIDIQLINITHLDIIPIQLIKVFVNSYSDKKVKIDSDVPFDIKIIIERAGFGSFMFKEEAA